MGSEMCIRDSKQGRASWAAVMMLEHSPNFWGKGESEARWVELISTRFESTSGTITFDSFCASFRLEAVETRKKQSPSTIS